MFTIITHVMGLDLLAFRGLSNQVFASHIKDVAEDSCNKLGEGAMLGWKNGFEQVKGVRFNVSLAEGFFYLSNKK